MRAVGGLLRRAAPAALVAAAVLLAAPRAEAQQRPLPWWGGLGSGTLGGAAPWGNPIGDDRVYVHGILNQNEGRFGDGSYYRWDGEVWAGTDWNRLRLRSEGRYNQNNKGRLEDGQHEALYSRAVSTFFDVVGGVRYDLDAGTGRTWTALGVEGLAPGFWRVSATAYASDNGHFAFRAKAFYDLFLTQRLVLQPQAEVNAYSKQDRGRGLGAGLSDIDMGLRLRYDVTRKFSPYVGVTYQRWFGGTLNARQAEGLGAEDLRFVAGIRTWF